MPRLHYWIAGAAVAGGSYLLYTQKAVPHYNSFRKEETLVEEKKFTTNSVLQAYAALVSLVKLQEEERKLYYDPGEDGTDTSGWFTNDDKLRLYLRLQAVRDAVFSLDMNHKAVSSILSDSETERILGGLRDMEKKHCTVLNFRERPLSFGEACMNHFCYVLYRVIFLWARCVNSLLEWPAFELGVRKVTSWVILKLLEIDVELRVSANGVERLAEGYGVALLPHFQHWIEEVGFYGALWKHAGMSRMIEGQWPWYAGEWYRKESFGLAWRQRFHGDWRKGEALLPSVDPCVGYPFVMRTAIPSQPSIPIVVSGLPSVLYAHPSFARRDVEGQRRRNALLQHIQEVQFDEKRDPTPTTGGRASTPEERWMRQWRRAVVRSDDTTESVVDWLRRWKFTQVLPLLSFSTNLVYGGPSPTGDRQQPRRTLRYYVGSASEADSRTGEVKNVMDAYATLLKKK